MNAADAALLVNALLQAALKTAELAALYQKAQGRDLTDAERDAVRGQAVATLDALRAQLDAVDPQDPVEHHPV